MASNLFEAAEANGVRREELVGPLGLDAARLVDPKHGIDWDTLVAALERLSEILGGDVEALRRVGRSMASVPSYVLLQRDRARRGLAQEPATSSAFDRSLRRTCLISGFSATFPAEDRLRFRCTIPEPYAASLPYSHVLEGLVCGAPTVLGLPPATIVTSAVTARELDVTVAFPLSRSIGGRVRRIARAAFHGDDVVELFEPHRREIVEGLEAAKRSTAEVVTVFDRLPNLVVLHRDGKSVGESRSGPFARP